MRGSTDRQISFITTTPEQFVAHDHPIRRLKPLVDAALATLDPVFQAMYAKDGRPSIPPEHLLKACLLTAFYSIRSERQFCERLQHDILFKWFLDLNLDDPAFDQSTFSKNRDRLLRHEVSRLFFEAVLDQARELRLLSNEHFTVDGTLLESWASLKSLKPRAPNLGGQRKPKPGSRRQPPPGGGGRNPEVDFHGHKRANDTHVSGTDEAAMLARKGNGREAKLCFAGHLLMENRHGLAVDVMLTKATGRAEREAGLKMLSRVRKRGRGGKWRLTVGADKNYDTTDFVHGCRALEVTPHVAQNITSARGSKVDDRTVTHLGYHTSQRIRKRIEEIFGWRSCCDGGDRRGADSARGLRTTHTPREFPIAAAASPPAADRIPTRLPPANGFKGPVAAFRRIPVAPDIYSLRWNYPDQVRRVGVRKRPLSPSPRDSPNMGRLSQAVVPYGKSGTHVGGDPGDHGGLCVGFQKDYEADPDGQPSRAKAVGLSARITVAAWASRK